MANGIKALVEWLINISRELGGAATTEESLHIIIENIKNHYPHQTLAVLTTDENTSHLFIRNARNLSYSFINNFSRGAHGSVTDELLMKHDCVCYNNMDKQSPAYSEIKLEHDFNHVCLAPIIQNQRVIGYLHCDRVEGPLFTEDDAKELLVIGYLVGQQIARHELTLLMRNLVRIDEPSKAMKYHAFLEQYRHEIVRAKTYNTPVSLMLLSIDNYAKYVTACGIQAGHALLEKFCRIIQANAREMDIVGRFSADKLIVCLGGMNAGDAQKTITNIRDCIEKQTSAVSCSPVAYSGVCLTLAEKEDLAIPPEQVFAKLGSGLIMARKQGHNQVLSITPPR